MKYFLLLLAGSFLVAPVHAETAYVTDMLQLDMFATPDLTGESIRKLRSGDRVEVLERDGRLARVSYGGQQGWVKGLYLVADEPARTRVNDIEEQNDSLQKKVASLQSQLAAAQGKVSDLETAQSGEADQLAAAESELTDLRQQNAILQEQLAAYTLSVPLSWLGGAMLFALVAGFAAGWYWIDRRSRARHGGFRVY